MHDLRTREPDITDGQAGSILRWEGVPAFLAPMAEDSAASGPLHTHLSWLRRSDEREATTDVGVGQRSAPA